jgi:hypothetical protein
MQLADRVAELEATADRLGYMDVVRLEDERAALTAHLATLRTEIDRADALAASQTAARRSAAEQQEAKIHAKLAQAQAELAQAQAEIVDVRAAAGIQELGVYDYEHPAEDSSRLATELESVRAEVKDMVRMKTAASASSGFTFNNSAAKGRKFVSDMSKILLRAYNAEAENCIKTVRAGNLAVAQSRLSKAADQIARQGSMIELRINPRFHALRLREIELANRHLAAVQREKELERERRAELREQKKAEQELLRERERLLKEQGHYQATLAALQANGDLAGAERMRAQLADVQRAMEDVEYRTANIRAGYVYVISNRGSFGDHVVKIGMTRRLEPMDRVRELGDASVPFRFDVHALFFAHDAVSIEAMLHRRFAAERVNQVNLRREYFYTTPDAVLEVLHEENVEIVEYRVDADAEEFTQSQSIRAGGDRAPMSPVVSADGPLDED